MSSKQRRKDLFLQMMTYAASLFSLLTLSLIVFFVASNGLKLLNMDLIRNNYLAVNYIAEVNEEATLCIDCDETEVFPDNVYYSTKWGIALEDDTDLLGKNVVEVYYIHPDSPFNEMINKGVSEQTLTLDKDYSIIRIAYSDLPSSLSRYGAERMISELDLVETFRELEFTTTGGGIRGSIITTLYLIGLTLIFALPIGVGAAIYLNEYAARTKFTNLVRSLIETLTGVPSII